MLTLDCLRMVFSLVVPTSQVASEVLSPRLEGSALAAAAKECSRMSLLMSAAQVGWVGGWVGQRVWGKGGVKGMGQSWGGGRWGRSQGWDGVVFSAAEGELNKNREHARTG